MLSCRHMAQINNLNIIPDLKKSLCTQWCGTLLVFRSTPFRVTSLGDNSMLSLSFHRDASLCWLERSFNMTKEGPSEFFVTQLSRILMKAFLTGLF